MHARLEAVPRHSPTLWGLLGAMAGELLLVAVWNAWDRRADLRRLGRALVRT